MDRGGGCCHGVSESFFFFFSGQLRTVSATSPTGERDRSTVPAPVAQLREIFETREKRARSSDFFYSTEIIIGRYH